MNHIDTLNAAYEAGWVEAACWAKRDDLMADIESAAYIADREAHLDSIRAALAQPELKGCACRWDADDNRVVTCTRHQGWLDVVQEWADRAKEAEAKLAQPEPLPKGECFSNGKACAKCGHTEFIVAQPEPTAQILADRLVNAVIAFATPEGGDVSDIGLQPEPVPIGEVKSVVFGASGFHVYLYPNQRMPKVGDKLFPSAALAQPEPVELTDEQIKAGWEKTFSTNNPYCPCNLKSFTKAVKWAMAATKGGAL